MVAAPLLDFVMRLIVTALLTLASCTQFPELDATIAQDQANAPVPALVPLGPVIAAARTTADREAQIQPELNSRLAKLRARAARLRGPVITPADRARMMRGIG